jgi:hypothetical protein
MKSSEDHAMIILEMKRKEWIAIVFLSVVFLARLFQNVEERFNGSGSLPGSLNVGFSMLNRFRSSRDF